MDWHTNETALGIYVHLKYEALFSGAYLQHELSIIK